MNLSTYLASFSKDSVLTNGGWMLDANSRLLFWVPPFYRVGLWRPENIAVLSRTQIKLDLTRFAHGSRWEECRS